MLARLMAHVLPFAIVLPLSPLVAEETRRRNSAVSMSSVRSTLRGTEKVDFETPGFSAIGELPTSPAFAVSASGASSSTLAGQITVGVLLGSVDGHLQTPSGGEFGTTSSHRPRTEEIGLSGLEWMPALDLGLRFWDRHELHANYLWADFAGNAVLGEALVSQARRFPAGAPVDGKLDLHLLRAGYRLRDWQLCFDDWSFVPEVGIGIGHLAYRLRSAIVGGSVDRSYSAGFPYLGVLLERPLTDRLRMELDFAGSGGVNGVSFVDTDLRLVQELMPRPVGGLSLVVGLRGSWFRRHDSQHDEQNDPNLRLGAFSDDPWGGLSLGLRFVF